MNQMRTVAAAGALLLAVTGCSLLGEEKVPVDDLEEGVSGLLEEQVGQPVSSVDCDDDLAAEVGSEVRCTLEAEDGTTIGLTVTAESVDGDEVNYEVVVDDEMSDAPTGGETGQPSPEGT